jgi:hypothetical protein
MGDTIWVEQSMPGSNPVLIDGGSTGRTQYLHGHAAGSLLGGRNIVRGIAFKGSWGAVATFSNTIPDGNRGGPAISRDSEDNHVHDIVINGSGRAQDSNSRWAECFKAEGTRTTVSNFWLRNCLGQSIRTDSVDVSKYARVIRFAHGVIENSGGPISTMSDYGTGAAAINSIQLKNIIVKDYAQRAGEGCCGSSPYLELMTFGLVGSQTLESIGLRVDGMTIENASGSCADVKVMVYGGANSGNRTLAQWEAIYPNVFNNITCTTDVNLDSLPSASTDVTVPNMAAFLTLAGDDTLSRATGVALTTTTSSGTGSTDLCVADVTWFSKPSTIPAPSVGQWSGGYTVHIAGVGNVTYTAADPTDETGFDGCITLATPQSWANGAAVNYGISSGSTPNRGYVR